MGNRQSSKKNLKDSITLDRQIETSQLKDAGIQLADLSLYTTVVNFIKIFPK